MDWYRKDLDPDSEMIKLSTLWEEHTYWYIEAVGTLRQWGSSYNCLPTGQDSSFWSGVVHNEDLTAPHLRAALPRGTPCDQLHANPDTIASYHDTFRLLLKYAASQLGREPTNLQVLRLEEERSVSIGLSTLDVWLRKRGFTFKKRPHMHCSRSGQTS